MFHKSLWESRAGQHAEEPRDTPHTAVGSRARQKERGEKGASGKLKFITPGSPSYKEHLLPRMMATGPNTGLTPKAATVDSSAPPDLTQRSKPLTEPQTAPPWLWGLDDHRLT